VLLEFLSISTSDTPIVSSFPLLRSYVINTVQRGDNPPFL